MASKQEQERREIRYTDAAKISRKQIEDQESGGDLLLPEGLTFLNVEQEGAYNLDIIPYVVGKNAKLIHEDVEPGDVHYEFSYWCHFGVGPQEKNIVCLSNWGEKCPLCERAAAFKRGNDMENKENKATYNSMKAKLRTLFNVIDQDARGKPKIQLFGYSWHGFAKQLANKIDGPLAERLGYKKFFHLKGGMTVQAKMSKTDMGKWLQCSNIEMLPRKDDLPADLLKQAPCLDEMIIRHGYDEVIAIADGKPLVEDKHAANGKDDRPAARRDEDEDRPRRRDEEDKPVRRRDDDDENLAAKMGLEEGVFVKYDGVRCKVIEVNRAGTKVDLEEVRTGEVIENVRCEDCEVPKPEVDDDRPARRRDRDDEDAPRRRAADDDRPAARKKDEDEDKGWVEEDEPKAETARKPKDDEKPVKRGPGRPRKET
jgi:hypothetical protein